jgi:molecular chaperone DnaK
VADRICDHITRTHRIDPRTNPVTFGRLRMLAETIKVQLSVQSEASMEITDIGYGDGGQPLKASFRMTRDELEQAVGELVSRTIEVSRFSIETIGMKVDQFDRIILVGGATRMPMVQRAVQEFFQKPPHIKINPDEVVALGAAIQAYSLNRTKQKAGREPAPAAKALESARASAAPAAAVTGPGPGGIAPPVPELPIIMPGQPQAEAPQGASALGSAPRMPTILGIPGPQGATTGIAEIARAAPTLTFSPPPAPVAPLGVPTAPAAFTPMELAQAFAAQPPSKPQSPQLRSPVPPGPAPSPPETPQNATAIELDLEPDPSSWRLDKSFQAPNQAPPSAPPLAAAEPLRAIAPRAEAPLLIDVTPLSLRVETVAGFCEKLIAANTPVPCDRTKVFRTASDNQTQVVVRVAQGESNRFDENTYLGEVELAGIPAAPRGDVRIAVTFELDADGILNVRACDEKSGHAAAATLKLLGANTDASDVAMMMARQQKHNVH